MSTWSNKYNDEILTYEEARAKLVEMGVIDDEGSAGVPAYA